MNDLKHSNIHHIIIAVVLQHFIHIYIQWQCDRKVTTATLTYREKRVMEVASV